MTVASQPEYSLRKTDLRENASAGLESCERAGINGGVFSDHASYAPPNFPIRKPSSAIMIRS